MLIPESVQVGPYTYAVVYEEHIRADDDQRLMGQADHMALTIRLDKSLLPQLMQEFGARKPKIRYTISQQLKRRAVRLTPSARHRRLVPWKVILPSPLAPYFPMTSCLSGLLACLREKVAFLLLVENLPIIVPSTSSFVHVLLQPIRTYWSDFTKPLAIEDASESGIGRKKPQSQHGAGMSQARRPARFWNCLRLGWENVAASVWLKYSPCVRPPMHGPARAPANPPIAASMVANKSRTPATCAALTMNSGTKQRPQQNGPIFVSRKTPRPESVYGLHLKEREITLFSVGLLAVLRDNHLLREEGA